MQNRNKKFEVSSRSTQTNTIASSKKYLFCSRNNIPMLPIEKKTNGMRSLLTTIHLVIQARVAMRNAMKVPATSNGRFVQANLKLCNFQS